LLPTFDGKYKGWLFFINFNSMIQSQSDLSDVDKLQYLKSALTANKLKILAIDGTNYARAVTWESVRGKANLNLAAYLIDLEFIGTRERKHEWLIKARGRRAATRRVIRSKRRVRNNGKHFRKQATEECAREMGNDRDTFPIDEMYEFLYKSAVCASKCERKRIEKEKGKIPTKRKRVSAPKSGIVLNTSRDCIMCKTSKHPLFMCEIQAVPVLKRIEAIKNVKLCYNCLRSHRACKFSNCTICQKTSKYTLTRYTSMMIFFPKKNTLNTEEW